MSERNGGGGVVYLKGDATAPAADGVKIIAHICNDIGGWGAGFVLAVSKKWKAPEQDYRQWHKSGDGFALGELRLVPVSPDTFVANMIAQRGVKADNGIPPIRYEALRECLAKLAVQAAELKAGVHMPRIGCGLAGGSWDMVEPLIRGTLVEKGIAVFVYDFG